MTLRDRDINTPTTTHTTPTPNATEPAAAAPSSATAGADYQAEPVITPDEKRAAILAERDRSNKEEAKRAEQSALLRPQVLKPATCSFWGWRMDFCGLGGMPAIDPDTEYGTASRSTAAAGTTKL